MKIVLANELIFSELVGFHLSLSEVTSPKPYYTWPKGLFLSELKQSKFLLFLEDGVDKDKNSIGVQETRSQIQAYLGYREGLDFIDLMLIAVHQNSRGKGIAEKLIGNLQKISADTNRKIILEVHQDNLRAINLYSRLGFKVVHLRKRYYQDGGNALIMEWQS